MIEDTKKYDIVVVSGAFDPVHRGHIYMLRTAKQIAHKVICGINSDNWVVKHRGKVMHPFAERAAIMESIRYVDDVMSFSDKDNTAVDLLTRVHNLYPDCLIAFANGGDRNSDNTPESGFCRAYGIDLLFNIGGHKVQSSSDIKRKMQE